MKIPNAFWKIIFLCLPFSCSEVYPVSETRDNLMVPALVPGDRSFYLSNQHDQVVLRYVSEANLPKVYHHEAVSFLMRERKRFIAYRYPGPESGLTRLLFCVMLSSLILAEIIFSFIFHQWMVMDLNIEWFNLFQL